MADRSIEVRGGGTLPGPIIAVTISPPFMTLVVDDRGATLRSADAAVARWLVTRLTFASKGPGRIEWHCAWADLTAVRSARRSLVFVRADGSTARFKVRRAARLRGVLEAIEQHGIAATRVRSTLLNQ